MQKQRNRQWNDTYYNDDDGKVLVGKAGVTRQQKQCFVSVAAVE